MRHQGLKMTLLASAVLAMVLGLSFRRERGASVGKFSVVPSALAQSGSPSGVARSSGAEEEPLVVQICDGETKMQVEGVKAGGVIPPERAPEVARQMMALYAAQQAKQATKWTARDRLIWEREQKRLVEEGDRLFHDWKALGGTIGISCDMCHPNASNTHPETYPKFQTQLKKMAALRDQINWCIENPLKGKPLALDDPRILAVEAYITSTRKGVPLDPGKH